MMKEGVISNFDIHYSFSYSNYYPTNPLIPGIPVQTIIRSFLVNPLILKKASCQANACKILIYNYIKFFEISRFARNDYRYCSESGRGRECGKTALSSPPARPQFCWLSFRPKGGISLVSYKSITTHETC
jgi:hypothetical protein